MADLITRQAAIDVLDRNHILGQGLLNDTLDHIADAIMALPSAQPETHEKRTETHGVCLDVIDRQATLDWLKNEWNGMITSLFDGIKALPSAQPDMSEYSDKLWKAAYERGKAEAQQRWIPCSERLPDEEVLCCDTRGEMIIGYPYPDEESNTGFSAEFDDVFMIDCAAWMPLPKPYRAERRTE